MSSDASLSKWGKTKEILRIAYTLPFVLSSIVGVSYALTITSEWLIAVLIPLDVFFLALFVNFSNDYFDHKSGVDRIRFGEQDAETKAELSKLFNEKVFWSGNSFDRGLITERQGKVVMALIAAVAILIAIPIILYGGWIVVALGLVGLALAFFYTAPPVNLGARGLGETNVFLSFTFMAFFSYYVIAQVFDWVMLLLAVSIGLAAMMMRLSDEAPGYPAHVRVGEKNLLVRFGLDKLTKILTGLVVAFYIAVAGAILLEPWFAILLMTVPIPLVALKLYRMDDRLKYWRSIPQFLKLAVGTEMLIVVALIARTAWTSWL